MLTGGSTFRIAKDRSSQKSGTWQGIAQSQFYMEAIMNLDPGLPIARKRHIKTLLLICPHPVRPQQILEETSV